MGSTREAVVQIPGELPLHGIRHDCMEGVQPAWGLIFCDPFAEEKKCAHRVMVEAARAFCNAEFVCVRFDYRGCGDSPGEFGDFTPEDWLQDILTVARYVRETVGLKALGLLGLRLGAALAVQAADVSDDVDFLVLWEPVIDGKRYLDQNLRRSMIKAMLTDEDKFDAAELRRARQQGSHDFDGYQISVEMRRQIEAIDLLGTAPDFSGPSLVVNVTTREQPGDPFIQLAQRLGGSVVAVRQEPFWNRIGLIEGQPVVEATEIWLAEQQAAWVAHTAR